MINKFKKVKIAFDTPELAAMHIKNIYKDRAKFWNSREVQDVREEFLERYLRTSSDWLGDAFDTIDKLHIMEREKSK